MKGLSVSVLRNAEFGYSDCSNDGVSARFSKFILVGEGVPEIFEATADMPVLVLVRRNIGGRPYVHAEPLEKPPGMVGPMFGGNFVHTSDSRFPNSYPIPIHDRFETPDQYERMSR